jgi:hypothetical protein
MKKVKSFPCCIVDGVLFRLRILQSAILVGKSVIHIPVTREL